VSFLVLTDDRRRRLLGLRPVRAIIENPVRSNRRRGLGRATVSATSSSDYSMACHGVRVQDGDGAVCAEIGREAVHAAGEMGRQGGATGKATYTREDGTGQATAPTRTDLVQGEFIGGWQG
jgi:hypothetical protein